jgi:hypothetical protein
VSYPVFTLPSPPDGSWTWPIKRTPKYAAITQTPVSLRGQLNLSLTPYPVWEYEMSFGYLKGNLTAANSAINQVAGFFAAVGGSAGLWLFQDVFDYEVVGATFGTGDGTTTAFQLQRPLGTFGALTGWDLVQNPVGTPSIYIGGTLTTPASISSTGLVTFSSAPAAGAALTWSGQFYYLCHFTEDTIENLQMLQMVGDNLLWDCAVKFESVLL